MEQEINVWRDITENVTLSASERASGCRVTWHRTDDRPDEHFEVTSSANETVEQAIVKELRKRILSP